MQNRTKKLKSKARFDAKKNGAASTGCGVRKGAMIEPLEIRTLLSVSIFNGGGSGYVGNGGGDPPDTTGAAGPSSYIESSNSNLVIHTKSAGTIVASQSPSNFFFGSSIGNETPIDATSFEIADVTMVYDNLMGNGRFLIGDIDVDTTAGVSQYVFAVSKSNNPTTFTTADWTFYHITTTEGPAGGLGLERLSGEPRV